MQTQYISFCNKNGLNIKSNSVKTQILSDLENKYDIRIIDRHHEVFNKEKHFNRLERIPHVCSLKSNGNPYLMFLTKIDFVNTVVMIDKKIQMGYSLPRMIIIRLCITNDVLFNNTLIEGEMIHDTNDHWLFLISDLLVYCDVSLKTSHDLFKRVNKMYALLNTDYEPLSMDLFLIQIKKYVFLNDIQWLYNDFSKQLPYTTRGMYLKPLYCKFRNILLNYDNTLIKKNVREKYATDTHFLTSKTEVIENIKNNSSIKNEIYSTSYVDDLNCRDFNIQKTDIPDLYKIYDINNDNSIGFACVDSLKTSKMLSLEFKDSSLLTKLKFSCKKTKNTNFTNIWIPTTRMM